MSTFHGILSCNQTRYFTASHEIAVMPLIFFCEVLRLEFYLGLFFFFLCVTVYVIWVAYLDLNYDLLACFDWERLEKSRKLKFCGFWILKHLEWVILPQKTHLLCNIYEASWRCASEINRKGFIKSKKFYDWISCKHFMALLCSAHYSRCAFQLYWVLLICHLLFCTCASHLFTFLFEHFCESAHKGKKTSLL